MKSSPLNIGEITPAHGLALVIALAIIATITAAAWWLVGKKLAMLALFGVIWLVQRII